MLFSESVACEPLSSDIMPENFVLFKYQKLKNWYCMYCTGFEMTALLNRMQIDDIYDEKEKLEPDVGNCFYT
jgi:hypothetical protein